MRSSASRYSAFEREMKLRIAEALGVPCSEARLGSGHTARVAYVSLHGIPQHSVAFRSIPCGSTGSAAFRSTPQHSVAFRSTPRHSVAFRHVAFRSAPQRSATLLQCVQAAIDCITELTKPGAAARCRPHEPNPEGLPARGASALLHASGSS